VPAKAVPGRKVILIAAIEAGALLLVGVGAVLFVLGGAPGYDSSIPMVGSIKVDDLTVVAAEPNTTLHGLEAHREYTVFVGGREVSHESGYLVRFFFPWKKGRYFLSLDGEEKRSSTSCGKGWGCFRSGHGSCD
jgi:hypothetical protein